VAKLAQAGGLVPLLQPFAALYVLILATLAPLLAKESERLYAPVERLLKRRRPSREPLSETDPV
jgi:CPA2 family monovalent cation:H+ antiporter-2